MQRDRLALVVLLATGLTGACASFASSDGTGGTVGTGGISATGGSPGSGGAVGTGGSGTGGAATGGAGGSSTGGVSGSGGGSPDSGAVDAAPATDGPAPSGSDGGGAGGAFALRMTGTTMLNGKFYFKKGQTHGSGDQSPAMEWDAVPEALSYAISMQDTNNKNYHWVMYDIPPSTTKLPDNMMRTNMPASAEVVGAKNTGFGGNAPYGYFGPGADCRAYNFIVYAMKVATLPAMAANTKPSSIVNGGALASDANVLKKTAAVPVIGQSSGNMCP